MREGHLPILVVEDDRDQAAAMVDALEHAGLAPVVAVCDGVEALTWLHGNAAPRAVVLDVQLPRADGDEIHKYITGDESLAHVPTILITGYADLQPAMFPGVAAFLRKPVTAAQLVTALRRVL